MKLSSTFSTILPLTLTLFPVAYAKGKDHNGCNDRTKCQQLGFGDSLEWCYGNAVSTESRQRSVMGICRLKLDVMRIRLFPAKTTGARVWCRAGRVRGAI
jgi:hypothetical protein